MERALEGFVVLVVEDEPDNLGLLESILSAEGARVVIARTATQAHEWLSSNSPDVLVSDLSFPDGDGCALVASLRAREETARIPAIAVTGHAEDDAILRAIKAGFDRHLAKPVELDEVVAAILALLSDRDDQGSQSGTGLRREDLVRFVARGDMQELLSILNERADYRFSSLARFQGSAIVRLAHVDREGVDLAVTRGDPSLADPYSLYVRESRFPLVIEDAEADPRVPKHLLRQRVMSYVGVPLFSSDGSVVGALCHYDVAPRTPREGILEMLERVARLLRSELQCNTMSA
jgi:two-component system, OmpR family, response regulator